MDEKIKEKWLKLYQTADKFGKLKSWEWMHDHDIFGIKDSAAGEINFVSILGNHKEVFGINIYRGKKGLYGLLSMYNFKDPKDPDILHSQDCLAVSFEEKKYLLPEDLNIIKELSLEYKDNEWPLFRDFSPGFYPWFINPDDCGMLTEALEQVIDVVLRTKKDKKFIDPDKDTKYLVRVPVIAGNSIKWRDEIIEMMPGFQSFYCYTTPENTINLSAHKIKNIRKRSSWEAGIFYFAEPVQDNKNQRPYFPKVFVFADRTKGIILGFEIVIDVKEEAKKVIDKFCGLINEFGIAPEFLYTYNVETYGFYKNIAADLGIKLIPDKTRHIELIKKEMAKRPK